mgnify:FL=1
MCYTLCMRENINISLPAELKKQVDRAVINGNYSTRSEFIRVLLRTWDDAWDSYERKLERGLKNISVKAIDEATRWAKMQ